MSKLYICQISFSDKPPLWPKHNRLANGVEIIPLLPTVFLKCMLISFNHRQQQSWLLQNTCLTDSFWEPNVISFNCFKLLNEQVRVLKNLLLRELNKTTVVVSKPPLAFLPICAQQT